MKQEWILREREKVREKRVGEIEWGQCDQMAFTVFIICPFTTMKNCPIAYKICQSR